MKKIVKTKILKSKKADRVVSGETTLAEILKVKGAGEILSKNGVPCLSCPMVDFEIDELKIGEVCKTYGLNLKKILKELNKS